MSATQHSHGDAAHNGVVSLANDSRNVANDNARRARWPATPQVPVAGRGGTALAPAFGVSASLPPAVVRHLEWQLTQLAAVLEAHPDPAARGAAGRLRAIDVPALLALPTAHAFLQDLLRSFCDLALALAAEAVAEAMAWCAPIED